MRRSIAGGLALAASLALAPAATAANTATLDAQASPLRLSTKAKKVGLKLTIAFKIRTDDGATRPARLTRVTVKFPQGAAVNASRFPTCAPSVLENKRPADCPKGSKIGTGTALANAEPLLPTVPATIQVFNGTRKGGKPTIIFFAKADLLSVQFVIVGTLTKTSGTYGYTLDVPLPDLTTLPGQPFAAVTDLKTIVRATAKKRTRVRGRTRTVTYNYLDAPRSCPRTGFPFTATLGYDDATTNEAADTIACPR